MIGQGSWFCCMNFVMYMSTVAARVVKFHFAPFIQTVKARCNIFCLVPPFFYNLYSTPFPKKLVLYPSKRCFAPRETYLLTFTTNGLLPFLFLLFSFRFQASPSISLCLTFARIRQYHISIKKAFHAIYTSTRHFFLSFWLYFEKAKTKKICVFPSYFTTMTLDPNQSQIAHDRYNITLDTRGPRGVGGDKEIPRISGTQGNKISDKCESSRLSY